ncbi:MAG: hypothetical protein JWP97_5904 [Labilithrix sp.]|nr:hypothetical protein [Labilithrix sp.]
MSPLRGRTAALALALGRRAPRPVVASMATSGEAWDLDQMCALALAFAEAGSSAAAAALADVVVRRPCSDAPWVGELELTRLAGEAGLARVAGRVPLARPRSTRRPSTGGPVASSSMR